MTHEVTEIKTRMDILGKTDSLLEFILDFNKRLAVFDKNVADLQEWLSEGRKRLDGIKKPTELLSPEDRVTKTMEVQEDVNKKSEFCSKQEAEEQRSSPKLGKRSLRMPRSSSKDLIQYEQSLINLIQYEQ